MLDFDDPLELLGYRQRSFPEAELRRYRRSLGLDEQKPVPPEEADSIVSQLAHGGLGALHSVGSLLDVGGPTVRQGVSSLFGLDATPEDPEYGLTGWDLTKAMGLEGQPGLDWSDIPSFAVDVATSPLTYLNPFHAATKGATVLKKAGLLKNAERVAMAKAAKLAPAMAAVKEAGSPKIIQEALGSVGAKTLGAQGVPGRLGPRFVGATTTVDDILDTLRPGAALGPEATAAEQAAWTASEAEKALKLNQARVAAETAGTTLEDIAGQKLRGALNIGLPGTQGWTIGTNWENPLVRGAGNTLDLLGDKLRWSWPGRMLASKFSAPTQGAMTERGQMAARGAFEGEGELLKRAHDLELSPLMKIQEIQKSGEVLPDDLDLMLQRMLENKGLDPPTPFLQELDAKILGLSPRNKSLLEEAAAEMGAGQAEKLAKQQASGLAIDPLKEIYGEYAKREMVGPEGVPSGFGSRVFNPKDPAAKARLAFMKNIPGTTATHKAMAVDPQLVGLPENLLKSRIAHLKERYGIGQLPPELASDAANIKVGEWVRAADRGNYGKVMKDFGDSASVYFKNKQTGLEATVTLPKNQLTIKGSLADQAIDQPGKLAQFYSKTDAQWMPAPAAFSRSMKSMARSVSGGEGLLDLLGKQLESGDYASLYQGGAKGEMTPLIDILKSSGMTRGEKMTEAAARRLSSVVRGTTPEDFIREVEVGTIRVPKSIADDATRIVRGYAGAEEEPLKGVFDWVNQLWKAGVTSPWPAFHVRNLYSGQVQNMLNGAWDLGSANEVRKILGTGQPVPGMTEWAGFQPFLPPGATDQDAFRLLQQAVYRNESIGQAVNMGAQEAKRGLDITEQLATSVPGQRPFGIKNIIEPLTKAGEGQKWNPFSAEQFALYQAGKNAGWWVESMNRMVGIVNLVKKGWSPDAAADFVKLIQVEYGPRATTAFEKAWMKRLIPFYSYQKGMVKYVIGNLLERPGGPLAQTIRASAKATEGGQVMPDYVTQGAAIPITGGPLEAIFGTNPEGGPRVLGGLSLMHESPLQLLGPFAKMATGQGIIPSLKELGAEAISQTTPFAKGPAEFVTGKSFWQRGPGGLRDVEEQDPLLGRILANVTGQKEAVKYPGAEGIEPILANVLAPRLLSTLRQATDPRKRMTMFNETPGMEWTGALPGLPFWARALGGAQIVDVSPRSQDAMIREAADKQLMDTGFAKEFENVYLPKDVRGRIDPLELQVIDQLLGLKKQLTKRAKERAQGRRGEAIGRLLP